MGIPTWIWNVLDGKPIVLVVNVLNVEEMGRDEGLKVIQGGKTMIHREGVGCPRLVDVKCEQTLSRLVQTNRRDIVAQMADNFGDDHWSNLS